MTEFEYGNSDTIHDTTVLDIEVDSKGHVVAVWFRCQMLPYRVTIVDEYRASELSFHVDSPLPEIHAVKLKTASS